MDRTQGAEGQRVVRSVESVVGRARRHGTGVAVVAEGLVQGGDRQYPDVARYGLIRR